MQFKYQKKAFEIFDITIHFKEESVNICQLLMDIVTLFVTHEVADLSVIYGNFEIPFFSRSRLLHFSCPQGLGPAN